MPTSSRTRRTARNAAVSAGSNVLGKGATLVWTAVAARLLTQADLGSFFYALTLSLVLSAVAQWGFDDVLSQRASRDLTELPGLLAQSLAWQAAIGVPAVALTLLLVWPGRPDAEARLVLLIVLLAGLLEMAGESLRNAAAAAQQQQGTSLALIAQRVTTAVLVVVVLWLDGGVTGLAIAFLIGSSLGLLAHLLAVRRLGIRLSARGLRASPMREMLGQTWVLGSTTLVLMVLFRLDALLLEALRGDAAVAGYAAAYRLLETVLFVAFALRAAVFPVINSTAEPALVRRGMRTAIAAAGLIYLPFGVVCAVDPASVLRLLFGQIYADSSSTTLRWLAFAPLAYGIAYLANSALQARRLFRPMLLGAGLALVLNIGLNLWLIPLYGGSGAAFVTTVSYLLESAVVLVALSRAGVRVPVSRALAEAFAAAVVLAVVLLLSPLPLLVEGPIGAAVYALTWVLIVRRSDPEQLAVLRSLVPARRPPAKG